MTTPVNLNVNVATDPVRNAVTVNAETTEVVVALIGAQGARGYSIVTGEGEPSSSDGNIGDIYINTIDNSFWGPKTSSGWPAVPFYTPGLTNRHVHTQASPATTWVINHELGGYPSVTVVDTASTTVIGEVSYVSTSQVVVEFTAPFSGYAYLT